MEHSVALDHATRDYLDTAFTNLHEKIVGVKVDLASLKQEISDMKSNGVFVRPKDCQAAHEKLGHTINKLRWWHAMILGGSMVLVAVAAALGKGLAGQIWGR